MNNTNLLSTLFRSLLGILSPGGRRARLQILIYHQVHQAPDPLRPEVLDAKMFDWQMSLLAHHFTVLPLEEAIQRLRDGTLPARAACITFDDGYRDNIEVALPILLQYSLPATFFIATGFLNGGIMWHDSVIEAVRSYKGDLLDLSDSLGQRFLTETIYEKRRTIRRLVQLLKGFAPDVRDKEVDHIVKICSGSIPQNLMMTTNQVQQLLVNGMAVGCHTSKHPVFTTVSNETVQQEIRDGRAELEKITGQPVKLFAYPNGKPVQDYVADHVSLVREFGFDAAVSTASGVAGRSCDYWQLPRFTPWDKTPERFLSRLLLNCVITCPKVA